MTLSKSAASSPGQTERWFRRMVEEDIMVDIGDDGRPVGYDIQHASTKTDFIARLILGQVQAAAE